MSEVKTAPGSLPIPEKRPHKSGLVGSLFRGSIGKSQIEPNITTPTKERANPNTWWLGLGGIAAVTLVIQVSMVGWAWRHNLIYGFGDSLSHMTISRRIWDSPNPGLSQLGTNWLPLPHLLFAISTLWIWGWRTGLGGSIITIACAVVTSGSLYRIGQRTGLGNAGGWVAAMIVATNPSWSYVSSVPLTEPFTVAATSLATAGLIRWGTSERAYSTGLTALFCGLPTAAAMLTRYEAWGFAALAGVAVLWVSWRRFGWGHIMRRQLFAFAVLPALAVFWWLIFNWSVFGDPLAFEHGPYSSKTLVAPLGSLGLMYGKGNLPASFALYGKNVLDIAGSVTVVVAFIGLAVTFLQWRGLRQELWLCLAGVGIFVVASIWQGQVFIRLPRMIPPGVFNTRFGVESLPFLAVAAAQTLRLTQLKFPHLDIATLRRALALLMVIVFSGGWAIGLIDGTIPGTTLTVLEAKSDASAGADQRLVGKWLHQNAESGYILLDDTVLPVLPLIGFDFHRVIFTSSGPIWLRLLSRPRLATWVAVEVGNSSDVVWTTLQREGVFGTVFFPVAAFGSYVIYKQEPAPQQLPPDHLIPKTISGMVQ
ncbi:MAG: hypothetical protein EPN30_04510 [Actinomycetota bacterium]|nr:MAG: hypothetical protein EPN30_04510 [Actinomycetota bacterium]